MMNQDFIEQLNIDDSYIIADPNITDVEKVVSPEKTRQL